MGLKEQFEKVKHKDESNKRIVEALAELEKIMEGEGRGWLFSPIVQEEGDHRTLCVARFDNPENFWATIGMIIIEINKQVPEEYRDRFREGFIPMCQMVTELAFPKMRILPVE